MNPPASRAPCSEKRLRDEVIVSRESRHEGSILRASLLITGPCSRECTRKARACPRLACPSGAATLRSVSLHVFARVAVRHRLPPAPRQSQAGCRSQESGPSRRHDGRPPLVIKGTPAIHCKSIAALGVPYAEPLDLLCIQRGRG